MLQALVCESWVPVEQAPEPRNPVIVALISQGVQVCSPVFPRLVSDRYAAVSPQGQVSRVGMPPRQIQLS